MPANAIRRQNELLMGTGHLKILKGDLLISTNKSSRSVKLRPIFGDLFQIFISVISHQ